MSDESVTNILQRAERGDRSAMNALLPLVYEELRRIAANALGRGAGNTLQPTAVVHEAYVKLIRGDVPAWASRAHFFAVAARAMRQVLADHAKGKATAKRGGQFERITLNGVAEPSAGSDIDLEALEESLQKLAVLDPQQAQIVECRFLGGMTVDETAHVLQISARSVEREWQTAKAWLRRELDK